MGDEAGIFAFLDGASPWWWVAVGLAIGVVELLTFTTYLLGPAAACFAVAALLFAVPDAGGTTQVAGFAISVLLFGVLGSVLSRRFNSGGAAGAGGLNRRGKVLLGREAVVETAFTAGIGNVSVDGVVWRARLAPGADGDGAAIQPGERLKIADIDGATLVVSPLVSK
ncbi:MAG: NfeD family protein [Pseudomonadota bacterium]